jgi:hypothetical protein
LELWFNEAFEILLLLNEEWVAHNVPVSDFSFEINRINRRVLRTRRHDNATR